MLDDRKHAASSRRSRLLARPSEDRRHVASTTLYNDYELDDSLKLAALEETRLFFAELLSADCGASRRRFGLHVLNERWPSITASGRHAPFSAR